MGNLCQLIKSRELVKEELPLPSTTETFCQAQEDRARELLLTLDEMMRENEDLRRKLAHHDNIIDPTLAADLRKTKNENEALMAAVEKLQKTTKDLQNINNAIQAAYRRAKVDLVTADKYVETVKEDCRNLEANLTLEKAENNSLKQKLTSSIKPMLRTDNRMTENINERCRPSVIAMRYNTLESQEWMDAKDSLEDSTRMDEEKITLFLCSAIMRTYEASCNMYKSLELAISKLIRSPALAVNIVQSGVSSDPTTLPDEMLDVIGTRLRQICEHIDSEELVKSVKVSLEQEFNEQDIKSLISNKAINRYLHECARLTWQMAIQQPPMKMDVNDKHYAEERHKLWWSCERVRASKINHFIWPVLYDYENGNLLVKGCVFSS